MSWIKENKFLVGLCGGTLFALILLYVVGSKGSAKYDLAKEDFDIKAQEAASFEKLPLYPKRENLDAKNKALNEYRKAAETLQGDFSPFRPEEIKNVSPQAFTNELKAANDEVRKAFEDAGTVVPDAFFCGFENYKTSLAGGRATGILSYQLAGTKKLMLALAAARVSELKNLHRPALEEERGGQFNAGANVARPLPLEITFKGSEKAVRNFLSSVIKPSDQYFVIRSIRLANEKKDPPRASDAKFDKPAAAKAASGGGASDPFGGFVLPGEEPAEDAAPAEEVAPAPVADSSRILAQVLGNEELQVFVRLDQMQFLPAKKLP